MPRNVAVSHVRSLPVDPPFITYAEPPENATAAVIVSATAQVSTPEVSAYPVVEPTGGIVIRLKMPDAEEFIRGSLDVIVAPPV